MEPIRNDYPLYNYLEEIRRITEEEKIVLVFDEITAGFRLCAGGSHLELGVNPDVAVFAKGMTNGYPVAAIIGKKDVMEATQETFISSTFWTERIALAAAVESINCYQKYHVHEWQKHVGEVITKGWMNIAEKVGLKMHVSGILPLAHFEVEYKKPLVFKTYFTQEMLKEGFLAGTSVYASFAHKDEIIELYLGACEKVFRKIKNILDKNEELEDYLEGPVCHAGFERLN